jgi:hypothetical protein
MMSRFLPFYKKTLNYGTIPFVITGAFAGGIYIVSEDMEFNKKFKNTDTNKITSEVLVSSMIGGCMGSGGGIMVLYAWPALVPFIGISYISAKTAIYLNNKNDSTDSTNSQTTNKVEIK